MSDEPRRLLDDPSTSEELRQALRQASGSAPPIDVAAGLERLERAMEGGGGASSGGAGGSSGLSGVVGAGIVALAVVGGVMLWNPDEPTDVAPPPSVEERQVEESVVQEPVVEEPVIAPPEVAPIAVDEVSERSEGRAARPTPEDEDDALAREMAELAAARSALAADPQRALSLLERGRRRAGARSLFAEEREALTVLALSGLDRDDDARRRGAAFLGAHPTSAFAERVRRAIATD